MSNKHLVYKIQELDDYFSSYLKEKNTIFNQRFFSNIFFPKCIDFLKLLDFYEIKCGRHRCTFISEKRNVVIKVPNSKLGVISNLSEYSKKDNENHANCRLLVLEKSKIPIIIMEKLNLKVSFKDLPSWSKNYDCRQVGINKYGLYKAYDYE